MIEVRRFPKLPLGEFLLMFFNALQLDRSVILDLRSLAAGRQGRGRAGGREDKTAEKSVEAAGKILI